MGWLDLSWLQAFMPVIGYFAANAALFIIVFAVAFAAAMRETRRARRMMRLLRRLDRLEKKIKAEVEGMANG